MKIVIIPRLEKKNNKINRRNKIFFTLSIGFGGGGGRLSLLCLGSGLLLEETYLRVVNDVTKGKRPITNGDYVT